MVSTQPKNGNLQRLASTHKLEEKMDKEDKRLAASCRTPQRAHSSDSEKDLRLDDVKDDGGQDQVPKETKTSQESEEGEQGDGESGMFF